MRDVAAAAGVSKALVSIVFRGVPGASAETRRKVISAAERIGYRHHRTASLLALTRTRQLGVIHDLHNGFHAEVVDAVITQADLNGYQVVVSPRSESNGDEKAMEAALDFRCEGLILLGPTLPDRSLLSRLGNTPAVVVGRDFNAPNIDVAEGDDAAGMRAVVGHLTHSGHRRIAHVDGGSGLIAQRRRAGYEAAMRMSGLEPIVISGGPTEQAGYTVAEHILAQSPTAVVAFNDLCALGILGALGDAGVDIPEQISVTGYDDSPLARTRTIGLTSLAQDAELLGTWAVDSLLQRLDHGRQEPRRLTTKPTLKVRRTSGHAPEA